MKIIKAIAVLGILTMICTQFCGCSDITISGTRDGNFNTSGYNYTDSGKYSVGGATISDKITSLDISWINGTIKLSYHDENTVSFSESSKDNLSDKEKMRYYVDGSTLRIQFCESGYATTNPPQKNLELVLPKGMVFENANFDVVSADLNFGILEAENFDFNTVSGDVNGSELIVENKVDVDAVSGNFTLTDSMKADTFKFDSTSGDVSVANAEIANAVHSNTVSGVVTISLSKMCNVKHNSVSGDLNLKVPKDASFTIDHDGASGDVNVDMPAKVSKGHYVIGSGDYSVDASTVSGDVNVSER